MKGPRLRRIFASFPPFSCLSFFFPFTLFGRVVAALFWHRVRCSRFYSWSCREDAYVGHGDKNKTRSKQLQKCHRVPRDFNVRNGGVPSCGRINVRMTSRDVSRVCPAIKGKKKRKRNTVVTQVLPWTSLVRSIFPDPTACACLILYLYGVLVASHAELVLRALSLPFLVFFFSQTIKSMPLQSI